ncbi:MAG TPA: ABC transporter ATP-binding protein [Steroidobacteraceae bacterium]|nr:ABC transporter ATP-binding protein [Steroidobacteraceae bacterium]
MSILSELWSILTPRQKRYILLMQVVSVVMAFSTITGIAAIAPFFAVLGNARLIDDNRALRWLYASGGFTSHGSFMLALGAGFIGVVLLANLVSLLGTMAMNRAALRVGAELQTALFEEYLLRPYSFHTATSSTTLFNNIMYETTRVTVGILQMGFVLVTNLVTGSLIILAVLLVQPVVGIAMIVALAGGYTAIYVAVRNRLLRSGRAQSHFSTEQVRIVNESFGAIKEILVLQVQSFFRGRFEHASRSASQATVHSNIVAQGPRNLMECVAVTGLVGIALALASRGEGIGPWLGQLTFLAFAAYRLLPMLQQVFAAIVRIRADRPGLELIAPDLRSARRRGVVAVTLSGAAAWRERPQEDIRLQDVWFRYAPGRPWALGGLSLRRPARAAVGIVGANGSGKTTLVDVISGLLVPDSGVVLIDGAALDAPTRRAWQSAIAYVPQNIFLMDASIARNIALGVPPEAIDRRRLLEALRLAQLEELVHTLPQGYDQPIGERGMQLSGGQRQRIGIARALYREASVLLLDEATNALDGLTEQELMATLGRLRGRYTIILIAHRLSTVRACDVIFELEQGRLAGSGTYEGLLQTSEAFRRMHGVR